MIYAIRAVGTEFVKFGITNGLNAKKRLDTLQTGCPFPLELLATCQGGTATEQYIHLMLRRAGVHHKGEWFKWGSDAEAMIGMMKSGSLRIAEAEIEFAALPKHKRLEACLAYSQTIVAKHGKRSPRYDYKPASHGNDGATSPTGAAQALQPHKSIA